MYNIYVTVSVVLSVDCSKFLISNTNSAPVEIVIVLTNNDVCKILFETRNANAPPLRNKTDFNSYEDCVEIIK